MCGGVGYTVHFFSDATGNVIGNPILPSSSCARIQNGRTMSEHIDVDVSGLLRREYVAGDAGERADAHDVQSRAKWATDSS